MFQLTMSTTFLMKSLFELFIYKADFKNLYEYCLRSSVPNNNNCFQTFTSTSVAYGGCASFRKYFSPLRKTFEFLNHLSLLISFKTNRLKVKFYFSVFYSEQKIEREDILIV